ncbi:MAG TPA: hypothetical protein PLY87_21965 [Planctomycetaceae bacterium]|nr:hypothetical protein [Planctomycetaceae bacterium]HQZ67779.1 hypothetical protein [Planctomycetaceae bacterium]
MSQSIRVECPQCGRRLKISDPSVIGKKGTCPQCQHKFLLAATPSETATPAAEPSLKPDDRPKSLKKRPAPTKPSAVEDWEDLSSDEWKNDAEEASASAPMPSGNRGSKVRGSGAGKGKSGNQSRSSGGRGKLLIAACCVIGATLIGGLIWMFVLKGNDTQPTARNETPTATSAVEAALTAPVSSWVLVRSGDGVFSVNMPSEPVVKVVSNATPDGGKVELESRKSPQMAEGMFFNFNTIQYPAGAARAMSDKQKFVEGGTTGMLKTKQGAELLPNRVINAGGIPCAEIRFRYPAGTNGDGQNYAAGWSVCRNYLVGMTVYQFSVDIVDGVLPADQAEERLDQFFESIRNTTATTPGLSPTPGN